jgi:PAS domain S-box-containing protein
LDRIRSSEPYRIAFELAASGLALGTVRGTVLRANQALCQMLGYPSEAALIGTSFQELLHPEDVDRATHLLELLLAGKRGAYQTEDRFLRIDGSIVWVLSSVTLVRDHRKRPWYFVAQLQDLTSSRQLHELRRTQVLVESQHRNAEQVQEAVIGPLEEVRRDLDAGDLAAARVGLARVSAAARALVDELLAEDEPSQPGSVRSGP